MEIRGILAGRLEERVTLRIGSLEPHSSELTAEQIDVIAHIAGSYGTGTVHVTPRQTVEIPDVERSRLPEIMDLLETHGLYPASSGNHLRNVIACSRWCLYNAYPLSDLARKLNYLYHDLVLPGKTDISLSGCDFSCTRSRTSDIGIIARAEIEITERECKKCSLCIKEPLGCQVDAIILGDEGISIDGERCVRCGFCTNICRPGTIRVVSRSFDIYAGGCGGIKPKEAIHIRSLASEDEVVEEVGNILRNYSAKAEKGERLCHFIDRVGTGGLGQ